MSTYTISTLITENLEEESSKNFWENYNQSFLNTPGREVENLVMGLNCSYKSYTRMFFDEYHLNLYLNKANKNILQLGANTGEFLKELNVAGWETMGWDFSPTAIKLLKNNKIKCREIDLNAVEHSKLLYENELKNDLKENSHLFSFRVLEYLKPEALKLLLLHLINHSKKGCIFFFAYNTKLKEPETDLTYHYIPSNYIPSFFGARTDMEFLKLIQSPPEAQASPFCDEIFLVKKRIE